MYPDMTCEYTLTQIPEKPYRELMYSITKTSFSYKHHVMRPQSQTNTGILECGFSGLGLIGDARKRPTILNGTLAKPNNLYK